MERKAIPLEVKDINKDSRTAVIAHAAYDNIDRVRDISRKGMFTRSWNASKDISLYLNHNDEQAPGRVEDVFDDNKFAYTKSWMGTHTLGNDTLIMLDEKVIKYASFGYIVEKSNPTNIKGQNVRELKEVNHIETSVLTKMPANPLATIVSVTKAFTGEVKSLNQGEFDMLKQLASMDDQVLGMLISMSAGIDETSDLYSWILYQISRRADAMSSIRNQIQWNANELKSMAEHVKNLENFCRDTKASDDCIKMVAAQVTEYKEIIASYDTADTSLITNQSASSEGNDSFKKQLLLLQMKMAATA